MKSLRYDTKRAAEQFRGMARDFMILAPKRQFDGQGNNLSSSSYGRIQEIDEIDFNHKTVLSAKSAVFPIREDMFMFSGTELRVRNDEPTQVIIFLRACDIHALKVLDALFLRQGGIEDPYYQRRRQRILCVLIECENTFESCFCVSMGTNKTTDYAAFIRPESNGYIVQIKDDRLSSYFQDGMETQAEPRFVERNNIEITLPVNVEESTFTHPMWQEYTARCIGCGRCNISCPTCSCFTLQDVRNPEDESVSSRKRIWSSCQIKSFSRLAGNHDFRVPYGDRMRYKVLHKIAHFKSRNGIHMCVGCGRCDDVCPEYISMSRCVSKVSEVHAMTPEASQ